MTKNSFLIYLLQKKIFLLFFIGKLIRFIFTFLFLYYLVAEGTSLGAYSANQVLFFYLTYNFIDVMAQFFFRSVYSFRPLVISGDLDLVLLKPFKPLVRILLGGADIIDLTTIPFFLFSLVVVGLKLEPQLHQVLLYILLILNSLIIATAFHIFVVSMAMITLEIDHTVMIYRDLTRLGTIPTDFYKEPLRSFITFVIPIGIMLTFPAKVLIGILSLKHLFYSFIFGVFSILISLRFWKIALRKYSSASS